MHTTTKKPVRLIALEIAQIISALNKSGSPSAGLNIAGVLGISSATLSDKKGKYGQAIQLLLQNHFARRGEGWDWRLIQPLEDIESHLTKWIRSEKEQEGDQPTEKLMFKHKAMNDKFSVGTVQTVHRNAKSITLKVNNVTITIDF